VYQTYVFHFVVLFLLRHFKRFQHRLPIPEFSLSDHPVRPGILMHKKKPLHQFSPDTAALLTLRY
jgi:hypothetical protein